MNKSLLKFITDFGPLLIFFIVYSKSGKNLSAAIPTIVIATINAVLISYIIEKKIPYMGSAIFLHLTDNYKPTAGCIALKKKDFEIVLRLIKKDTKIKIG